MKRLMSARPKGFIYDIGFGELSRELELNQYEKKQIKHSIMAIPKFEDFLYPFMLHLTDGDSNKADMISVLSDFFDLSEEDKTLKTK